MVSGQDIFRGISLMWRFWKCILSFWPTLPSSLLQSQHSPRNQRLRRLRLGQRSYLKQRLRAWYKSEMAARLQGHCIQLQIHHLSGGNMHSLTINNIVQEDAVGYAVIAGVSKVKFELKIKESEGGWCLDGDSRLPVFNTLFTPPLFVFL